MIQLIACKTLSPRRCLTVGRSLQHLCQIRNLAVLSSALLPRVLILGAVLIVSGCANIGNTDTASALSSADPANRFGMGRPVAPTDRTIVADLVQVAAQIFTPVQTTLQINNTNNDPTLEFFIQSFSDKGFGIQRVRADQGAHYFSYTRTDKPSGGNPGVSYSTSIGAVEISRDYAIPATNIVAPASTVKLSGTRIPVQVIDVASGRKQVPDSTLSTAEYFASLNLGEKIPVISLITPDIVNQIATQSTQGPSLRGLNSDSVEVSNLFYGNDSTFSSVLDSYEKIDRQVIVFGNDSMVLGNTNKLLIDQFIDQRLGDSDIIGLIGCSNGPTTLAIGNEGLALGRAERVTQALLARGVPRDRVLDEGCWAPVSANDRFPGRGVVLELWRSGV